MPPDLERYAMFRERSGGSPEYVGSENDLEKAGRKVRELANLDGTAYFVYDFRLGITVVLIPSKVHKPPRI